MKHYFGRPKLDISLDELQSKAVKRCKYTGTFEELVRENIGHNTCFVLTVNNSRVLSYVSDIRFDYENGEIYCPCYTYDYFELPEADYIKYIKTKEGHNSKLLRYNCKFTKVKLWTMTDGWRVDNITLYKKDLFEIKAMTRLKEYSTKSLVVFNSIVEDSYKVLFSKYLRRCIKYSDLYFESEGEKYISCKYSLLQGTHKKYLKKYELNWYGDEYRKKTKISPIRLYNILDADKYETEELGLMDFSCYKERRFEFDCYLLSHISNKVYWYDLDINKLISGDWFFLKIKEKGISLVLKSEWFRR